MTSRNHSPTRRRLLAPMLALPLLLGCGGSNKAEPALLTSNAAGGDFKVSVDGKLPEEGRWRRLELSPGQHRLLVLTEWVDLGRTQGGAVKVEFVAEPGGQYELQWRRLSRAGRDYWRAGAPHAARVAYLFMTDSDFYPGQPGVYGQYDPSGGENAVIIQPGTDRPVPTMPMPSGPTLTALWPGSYLPDPSKPVEFAVSLMEDSDPPFRSYPKPVPGSAAVRVGSDPVPVDQAGLARPEDDFEWGAHYEAIGGNKLGGTPPPIDPKILSFPPERASLILQLDTAEVPFFVDFGDVGVGHLFFDPSSDKGYFTWSGA